MTGPHDLPIEERLRATLHHQLDGVTVAVTDVEAIRRRGASARRVALWRIVVAVLAVLVFLAATIALAATREPSSIVVREDGSLTARSDGVAVDVEVPPGAIRLSRFTIAVALGSDRRSLEVAPSAGRPAWVQVVLDGRRVVLGLSVGEPLPDDLTYGDEVLELRHAHLDGFEVAVAVVPEGVAPQAELRHPGGPAGQGSERPTGRTSVGTGSLK